MLLSHETYLIILISYILTFGLYFTYKGIRENSEKGKRLGYYLGFYEALWNTKFKWGILSLLIVVGLSYFLE